MKKWLKRQWRESLAADIWNDLTPFGRITVWIPIWLLCWASMPFLLVGAALAFPLMWLLDWLSDKTAVRIPPIFFK